MRLFLTICLLWSFGACSALANTPGKNHNPLNEPAHTQLSNTATTLGEKCPPITPINTCISDKEESPNTRLPETDVKKYGMYSPEGFLVFLTFLVIIMTLAVICVAGIAIYELKKDFKDNKEVMNRSLEDLRQLTELTRNTHTKQVMLSEIKRLYWNIINHSLSSSTSPAGTGASFHAGRPMEIYIIHHTEICDLEDKLFKLESHHLETVTGALRFLGGFNTDKQLKEKLVEYLELLWDQEVFKKPELKAHQKTIERIYQTTLQVLSN